MTLLASEAEVTSAMILDVNRWWRAAAIDGLPDRSLVDPLVFRSILPNMMIADVETTPFRVRFRLVGTMVVEATGFDFTGRYLDEMTPSSNEEPQMVDYLAAFERRAPVFGRSSVRARLGSPYVYEYGMFPLRKGGPEIAQFLSVEDYFNKSQLSEIAPWILSRD